MDKLADLVMSAFNTLSVGHDQNFVSLHSSLEQSGQHTAEVLGILVEDMHHKRKEFDNTMVGIGLRELRRAEKTMGGRIRRSEIHSFIQSFGLTPQQVQQVEREYDADFGGQQPE